MTTLKVWANDVVDWVIAESPEDADSVCLEHIGYPPDDPYEWTELSMDSVITLHMDDGRGTVEKTCADWIAEQGRCFLGSTEY